MRERLPVFFSLVVSGPPRTLSINFSSTLTLSFRFSLFSASHPTHPPWPPALPPLHWPPWPSSPCRLARSWRLRPVSWWGGGVGGRGRRAARRGARVSLPPHRARLHPAATSRQQRGRGTARAPAPTASGKRRRIGARWARQHNKTTGHRSPSGTPPLPPPHSRRPPRRGQHRQPPGGRRHAGHGAATHLQLRGDAEGESWREGGKGGGARGARQNHTLTNTPLYPSPHRLKPSPCPTCSPPPPPARAPPSARWPPTRAARSRPRTRCCPPTGTPSACPRSTFLRPRCRPTLLVSVVCGFCGRERERETRALTSTPPLTPQPPASPSSSPWATAPPPLPPAPASTVSARTPASA